MLKLLLLLVGIGGGAAASASWLLSTPDSPDQPVVPANSDSIRARVELLRGRFEAALAEGRLAGEQTESRLRQELDAYRRGGSA